MKVLLGYSYYQRIVDVKSWIERWTKRLTNEKLKVSPFCLTLNPPNGRIPWPKLDRMWKEKDKDLLLMYEKLELELENFDIFINWNGINLHPEFVEHLSKKTKMIYSCFDDPESSEDLSKPVASSYDLCLIGNIAEINTYKKWGVENVEFWPLGFFKEEYDDSITEAQIRSSERDQDITLLCERVSPWRKERLDKFATTFPKGNYYGRGWENGFLDPNKKLNLFRRTKIMPNFHNSTGPINLRTYAGPANGALLLCDNKSYLSKLYKLNEEAIGFDTVEEAIELCRYYLEKDEERQEIAIKGWKRALKDYNDISAFNIGINHIKKLL